MKVLLLEDESLILMLIEDEIMDAGHEVIPTSTLEAAFEAYESGEADCAILDVNLGNETKSFPIAHRMKEDGFPFAFMSGYHAQVIDGFDDFAEIKKLQKPIVFKSLVETIEGFKKSDVDPDS